MEKLIVTLDNICRKGYRKEGLVVKSLTVKYLMLLLLIVLCATPCCFILQIHISFWPIFDNRRIDAEIVNGIITISSIVFGFQYAALKMPKKGILKYLSLALVISEILGLAYVGFWYVADSLEFGYLSGVALMNSFSSLCLNLTIMGVLMMFNIFPEFEEIGEKILTR